MSRDAQHAGEIVTSSLAFSRDCSYRLPFFFCFFFLSVDMGGWGWAVGIGGGNWGWELGMKMGMYCTVLRRWGDYMGTRENGDQGSAGWPTVCTPFCFSFPFLFLL